MNRPNVLFVCGRNQWRGPTAERIYKDDPRIHVRSAGVSVRSSRQVSPDDLSWADIIIVMEQRYKSRILGTFRNHPKHPPIASLEIPDEYEFMDEELIGLIREGVESNLRHEFNIE